MSLEFWKERPLPDNSAILLVATLITGCILGGVVMYGYKQISQSLNNITPAVVPQVSKDHAELLQSMYAFLQSILEINPVLIANFTQSDGPAYAHLYNLCARIENFFQANKIPLTSRSEFDTSALEISNSD
jgi:hypothetical protein